MAMRQIVKYLLSTELDYSKFNKSLRKFKGIVYKPEKKGIEVFVDVQFAGD